MPASAVAVEAVRERASRAESMPEALRAGLWWEGLEDEAEGASSWERSSVPREGVGVLFLEVAVLLFLGVERAPASSAASWASRSAFLRAASAFLTAASSLLWRRAGVSVGQVWREARRWA